jgi:hypothetical protein
MQEELDRIRRRDFLRMGGSSVAAAGLSALLPRTQAEAHAEEPTGTRPAPAHPLVLRSGELEVTLDADDGLPYEYRLRSNGARLRGEDCGLKMTASLCQRAVAIL